MIVTIASPFPHGISAVTRSDAKRSHHKHGLWEVSECKPKIVKAKGTDE